LALVTELKDRNGEANNLTSLGSIYNQLGDRQKAIDYYNKALEIRQAREDKYGESYTLSAIGSTYSQLGNHSKALEYLNRALAISRSINDRPGETETLYQLSRLERQSGDLIRARARIEAALELVEITRTKVSLADARAIYFASRQELYDFYIDLLMQLYKSQKDQTYVAASLHANERRIARGLLDSLAESQSDIRADVASELLERERRSQQDLNAKADQQIRLLSRKHTAEQAVALAREIDSLTTEYEQTLAQIRQTSTQYAALTQPQTLSLKQIQTEVLDSKTLLLEYSLGEERSYLWVVSPTSVTAHELPKRAEIESLARRVYELLTSRNRRVNFETDEERRARISREDIEYVEAASALSKMILAPASAQMNQKRLVIVGDGALQYLPFAALPAPHASTRELTRSILVPLIARHEVVSLPSASTLVVLRKEIGGRKAAPKTIAVLADPVFSRDDERLKASDPTSKPAGQSLIEPGLRVNAAPESALTRSARDLATDGKELFLSRLPFTRQEAKAILRLVPETQSKKALDFAANKAMATDPELSKYRYVHFATHTILNSKNPGLSGIVLSLVDEHGNDQEGFLVVHEIYNLRLPADLVVLSSCKTGLGKEVKGEGMIGITRGFMYAGAARVLVSLWDVDDESTAEMMKRIYGVMLKKQLMSPASALRSAQVSMWKSNRWRAPYFWAAFVLQGEYR